MTPKTDSAKRRLVLRVLAALLSALLAWAFVVNRLVLHWVDGPFKTGTEIALGAALAALAVWSVWAPGTRLGWVSLGLLAVLTTGQVRQIALRHGYGVRFDPMVVTEILHPVTTTSLIVRRDELDVPRLGVSRVRVVHLSDLHVTEALPADYYLRVRAQVTALRPDLVVLTGDYVSKPERIPLLARFLDDFPKPPGGVFASLGNHEYWMHRSAEVSAVLSNAGVTVLAGECLTARLRGAELRVCGTDAPWGPSPSAFALRSTVPTLVLSHTPDNVYDLEPMHPTAVFAGHTHGGQIRIPVIGALLVPSRFGRRFDRGHFHVGETDLFVSAGVGADAPPLRLFCPPEIGVVDLFGPEPE